MNRRISSFLYVFYCLSLSSCYSVPGPDKSAAGTVLGTAWGAGAGAVLGNQFNDTGPGALLGMGFGAASGLLTGIGFDLNEGSNLQDERELRALETQVLINQQMLIGLQNEFDRRQQELAVDESMCRNCCDPVK